ncbi:MAG: type II toxin-antitoxin system RelE/ParE family toxin [Nostoc sp. S4]|nr:type II toxin-antitoxin system RelE/ParE family toxin [Nostoc sp. S4]
MDSALTVEDIRLPGYDLHELKADRKGTWSIKVSGNWRITFIFEDGDAYNANLEDYH